MNTRRSYFDGRVVTATVNGRRIVVKQKGYPACLAWYVRIDDEPADVCFATREAAERYAADMAIAAEAAVDDEAEPTETCDRCGEDSPASEFEVVQTSRQTHWEPAEYERMCSHCVGGRVRERDPDEYYDAIMNGDIDPPAWFRRTRKRGRRCRT